MPTQKKLSHDEIEKLLETDPWWKEISKEMDRVHSVRQLEGIVSDEQKSEVVEAMFEHLLISEEGLAQAQTDPVFQEAKGIIDCLQSGDTFPDKLIELYESKIPEALDRLDRVALTMIPVLSVETMRNEISALWTSNREAFATIDVNNLPSNLRVESPDDRYILRSLIKLQEWDDLLRNYHACPFPSKTYTPAAVSGGQNDNIRVGVGATNEVAEQSLKQRAKYLAYRIYDPLWYHQMERFEPEYISFPLKWINDASLLDYLYQHHKKGKDVITVFMSIYEDDDRLARIENAISSCPITTAYRRLFTQAISSYRDERFCISATALLPMIEGIIWEFAWWWNNVNGGLFDRPITHAQYSDGKTEYHLLTPGGSKVKGRPNVGALLRQTKFGEDVYFEVVEYLVAELFAERNPALHGRDPGYGTKRKAAALIFVVETLERQITGAFKKVIGKDLIEKITKDGEIKRFVADA